MDIAPLRRTNYKPGNPATPPSTCHRPEGHELEFQQFHYLTDRLHNAALHGAGVATGLEVVGAVGSPKLTVRAGVAVDPNGRMIVNPADLAVDTTTPTLAEKTLLVTIRFNEVPVDPDSVVSASVAPCGRIEQQPVVTLEASAPADAVTLGTVTLGAAGNVQSLTAAGRVPVGSTVGALTVRRTDDHGGHGPVTDAGEPAATLAPASGGVGLRLDVPRGPLQLDAETVAVRSELRVSGAVELSGDVTAAGRNIKSDGQNLDTVVLHVDSLLQSVSALQQQVAELARENAALTQQVGQLETKVAKITGGWFLIQSPMKGNVQSYILDVRGGHPDGDPWIQLVGDNNNTPQSNRLWRLILL
jgi:hypothetical protein